MKNTVSENTLNIEVLKQDIPDSDISTLTSQTEPLYSAVISDYMQFYNIQPEHEFVEVSHSIGYLHSNGYKLATHLFKQPNAKGTFFLLHGYYDHVGLFGHILRFLLDKNYTVLAYDLPGHGLSSGPRASIPDFSIYTEILEDILQQSDGVLPKPWCAFGQSTGCAIITDALNSRAIHQHPCPFDKVVFSAPLVRPWLWHLGRAQLYLARFFIKELPRKYTDNSRNADFIAMAHNDPLGPTVLPTEWVLAMDRWIRKIESSRAKIPVSPLILQGTYDRTVDARHNIAVLGRLFKTPDILFLKDARHHLTNELPETIEESFSWLANRL